jgi:putative DNA primase/helicase
VKGRDYVVRNPRRNDRSVGSFRIDIKTARFYDFASKDRGGDFIDLVAFVECCDLLTAGRRCEERMPVARKMGKMIPFSSIAGSIISNLSDKPAKKKKNNSVYIWNRSVKSMGHAYLERKRITIGNARVNVYKGRKSLLIPLTDEIPSDEKHLQIKGLQFIREDGEKFFIRNLSIQGLFHIASDYGCAKDTVLIAEGFATSRTIAEATELFTIAAMSACNMTNVTLVIHKLLPKSKIVIAADNDEAGRKAAEEASRTLGKQVQIIYPTSKDFNDMSIEIGPDGLRNRILNQITKETING